MPSKGETIYIENGGKSLFVGATDLRCDEARVFLKYRIDGRDEIRSMPLDEFHERRVYPEQLPNHVDIEDVI